MHFKEICWKTSMVLHGSHILIVIISALVLIGVAKGEIVDTKEGPQVTVSNGLLQGHWKFGNGGNSTSEISSRFAAFEGIPYGTIPGRFQPPKAAATWRGVLNATKPGPVCPQFDTHSGIYYDETEDCLFANVYVSNNANINNNYSKSFKNQTLPPLTLATMVWIHGGGFLAYSGSFFGPEYFMQSMENDKSGIILITFNYRLGALGFLNTAGLAGSNETKAVYGNMGLKDMVVLLEWVQLNIAAFGGDPEKVTIFGESAGGAAAHALLISPAVKKRRLFQKVIAQSGTMMSPWAFDENPKAAALRFASELNCTDSSKFLECFRNKSTREILEAQQLSVIQSYTFHLPFTPTRDAGAKDYSVFPKMPRKLILDPLNSNPDIPFIIGWNVEEGRLLAGVKLLYYTEFLQDLNGNWNNTFPELFQIENYLCNCAAKCFQNHENEGNSSNNNNSLEIDKIKARISMEIDQFYFKGSTNLSWGNFDEFTTLETDFDWFWGIKQSIMLHSRNKGQVFPYLFEFRGINSLVDPYDFPVESTKPGHGDELQYLFKPGSPFLGGWSDLVANSTDEEFSRQFLKLWISFAQNGNNTLEALGWHPAVLLPEEVNPQISWYHLNSKCASGPESQNLITRYEFWRTLFNEAKPETNYAFKNYGNFKLLFLCCVYIYFKSII